MSEERRIKQNQLNQYHNTPRGLTVIPDPSLQRMVVLLTEKLTGLYWDLQVTYKG